MINNISLKNFKCFQQTAINLSRITLLTGENSTGKSSVLYGLLAPFQSNDFPLYLSPNGRYVNMGDFKEISFNNLKLRVESIFRRLKSRMNISPLYVRRNDQIRGMTCLLTLGVRVLTLTEFVVRRSLRNDSAALGGLHPENRRKETDRPTAERLLKAFPDITLTVIKTEDGRVTRHLTPLSEVQKEILKRAGLKPSLYKDLEINKSPPQLTE